LKSTPSQTLAILDHVLPIPRSYAHGRSGATRRAILKAALECFADKGFAETTLDDVHRRSGISIGSIYHHFGSKEQIGGALYVEGLRDYQQSVISALKRSSDARTAIRSIVISHLEWIRANPVWSEYLFENRPSKFVVATELQIRQLNQNTFRETGLLLDKYRRRGEIMRLPLDVTIAILIGPAQQFARMWLGHRVKIDISVAADALADVVWRSIGSHGPED
jgi:AcrR family transcriptional regulator